MKEQAAIIRWEDPPRPHIMNGGRPRGSQNSRYQQIADQLRARRGEWALIEEGLSPGSASGVTSKIIGGRTICFLPEGDFEAVSRSGGRVYARYLGDGPA